MNRLICLLRKHHWTEQWCRFPDPEGPAGFNWWLCPRCGAKQLDPPDAVLRKNNS